MPQSGSKAIYVPLAHSNFSHLSCIVSGILRKGSSVALPRDLAAPRQLSGRALSSSHVM